MIDMRGVGAASGVISGNTVSLRDFFFLGAFASLRDITNLPVFSVADFAVYSPEP